MSRSSLASGLFTVASDDRVATMVRWLYSKGVWTLSQFHQAARAAVGQLYKRQRLPVS